MGADLYVKKMPRKDQYTGFQTNIEKGYFRDCYNYNGLFAFLSKNVSSEFSWWHLTDIKKDWFNKEGELKVEGAKELLKMLIEAKIKIEGLKTLTRGYDETDELTEKEVKDYKDWLNQLIDFLELTIEKKSPVIWSV